LEDGRYDVQEEDGTIPLVSERVITKYLNWQEKKINFFIYFHPAAGIAQTVYRRATGWTTGVHSPAGGKRLLSSLHRPDRL
jgi:hypothetical protein